MGQPFPLPQRLLAIGLALGGVGQAAGRAAQPEPLPQVVVSGSHLAQSGQPAGPVTVLDRDAIAASGAATLRALLDTLTAFDTGTLRDDGSANSFARGASAASLRGLGKGATLVLLNGRRVAPYPLADGGKEVFVNLDSFPLGVIEQVEVLRDGLSAIYGSDAMAGVINIVTRSTQEGVRVAAGAERLQGRHHGGQQTVSIAAGHGKLGRDGFHVLAGVDGYRRRGYMLSDTLDDYPAWHRQYVNPGLGEPSLYSFPGNLNEPRTATRPAVRHAVAGCPPARVSLSGLCTSELAALTPAADGAERVSLFSQARAVTAGGLRALAEVSYARVRTDYRALPYATVAGPAASWFNAVLGRSESSARPQLAVGNPANPYPFPVGIDYRFMDDPGMWQSPSQARQYRMLASLGGSGAGLAWQVAAGRVGGQARTRERGAHRDAMPAAVASGAYRIGGPNARALLERMFPVTGTDARTSGHFLDAKLSGTLMALPGGALRFAAGGELRREAMFIASSANLLAAEIIGRGAQYIDGRRHLGALFVELDAPLAPTVTVSGALRADKASRFDGHLSPRLALQYAPVPALQLRASRAHGFRAPGIPETLGRIGMSGFFNGTADPRRCATAQAIRDILRGGSAADAADAVLAYHSGCLSSVPAMIAPHPGLKPETASSVTLGMALHPRVGVRLALDYFRIERRHEIAARDANYVLAREALPLYGARIVRNAVSDSDRRLAGRANVLRPGANLAFTAGSLQSLLLQYENIGRTLTSGIELDLSARLRLGGQGTLTLGLASSVALRHLLWDGEAGAWRPNLVGLRGAPKYTSVLSAQWRQGAVSVGMRVHRSSRSELNFDEYDAARWSESACHASVRPAGELPCFTGAAMRTDLHAALVPWRGARLSVHVRNALKTAAPVDLRGGYTPAPRTLGLTLEHAF